MTELQTVIEAIQPLDQLLAETGQAHLDNLTKPQGSLGRLEDLALQMFMIQEGQPPQPDPMRIYTVAGDHGVVAEGVSLFPQEVTRQMVLNFLNGGAGINVLAGTAGAQLYVVDAGSCGEGYDEHPNLIQEKVAPGTANLAVGPAMTGPGTGLDKDGVVSKAAVIRKGLAANKAAVESGDAFKILAALGGLEIATLAGLIIGGAKNRQLVCVDGFISTAAYTAAWKLCETVREYCVISHCSAEPGHITAVEAMGLKPLLDLEFRLGEGTGAACAMYLVRSAADIYTKMATFADAGVAEAAE